MISRLKLLKGAGAGLAASLVTTLMPARAVAQNPSAGIHYQGRLTSPDGTPVADGSWPVVFRLFDGPTGGTALWEETASVTTRGGAFSTMLGRTSPFSGGLFTRPLWLEIEVNARKLTPRQELGAAPYAMTALGVPAGAVTGAMIAVGSITADRIADHTITERQLAPGLAVPIGSVVSWWGDSGTPPDGWAVCDGKTLSDSKSPLNGKALPDLRNKFVRGGTGDVRSTLVTGGADTVDLTHGHTVDAHTHGIPSDLNVGALKALGHNHQLPDGRYTGDESSNGKSGNFAGGSFLLMINGDRNKSEQNLGHSHGGATAAATPNTGPALGPTSLLPSYVGLIYIVRVR